MQSNVEISAAQQAFFVAVKIAPIHRPTNKTAESAEWPVNPGNFAVEASASNWPRMSKTAENAESLAKPTKLAAAENVSTSKVTSAIVVHVESFVRQEAPAVQASV